MEEVLLSISVIIALATILALITRAIKQPPIIAYIITGIIVGPLVLGLMTPDSSQTLNLFAQIGVAFLLFIVGLNLDLRVLKDVGKVSLFAGLSEVIITGTIGGLIAYGLGMGSVNSLYLAVALAFSSTVVVVKILSDKKEIDTLHGRIALGILIIEDFIASIALMIIPLLSNISIISIVKELAIGISLIISIFLVSHFILNRVLDYLARNQEILLLFGISWALIIATLFSKLGFSVEIGALIAGMSLASSRYHLELAGKIKSLRDFFIVLFFVYFGSRLAGQVDILLIEKALLFSAFIVIGKPIIVMTMLRIFGYRKRTNFLAGSSLAQISEFSLIITLLGFSLGHIGQEIISLVILVAVFTIGISSYSIYYSHNIFERISHLLNIFENKKHRETKKHDKSYDVILFGYHRIGYKVLKELKEKNKSFVVVDYNPQVILHLGERGIDSVYGDAGSKELLEELGIERTKLIISTIPDRNINLIIQDKLKEIKSSAVFIATAEQPRDALDLYESGVDFVLVPHHLGGEYASSLIEEYGFKKSGYKKIGKEHFKELRKARSSSKFN